jgi:RimJ/RimL family protein N-acetyltransferase
MRAGTAVDTERLLLRRWRDGDADAFAAINADPEVMRFIGTGRTLTRLQSDELLARFAAEWDERGFGLWAVQERGDDPEAPLLGFCGLTVPMFLPEVLPAVEVGWRLAPHAWGRGVATEAARAALAFGFQGLGMREIISIVHPRNARSLRVCAKLGMVPRADRMHPGTRQRLNVFATGPAELHWEALHH